MTPFETIAPAYDALWSDAPRGRAQRAEVWREIDRLFHAGDRILDLGCGTGDDALYLAERGVEVVGIDSSVRMVEIARGRGVDARLMEFSESRPLADARGSLPAPGVYSHSMSRVREGAVYGDFSGAISNFGALNCVRDLRPIAESLGQWIKPGGPLAICLMGRFSLADLRHAAARLRGRTRWRGIDVYYPTSRAIRSSFAPWFDFDRRVAIGRGDHQLYIFRRRSGC